MAVCVKIILEEIKTDSDRMIGFHEHVFVFRKEDLSLKVVILAAGMSTRLRNITGEMPKVLTKLKGIPIIEYVIQFFSGQGYQDIIITTHYKHEKVVETLGNGEKFGVNISYEYEPILLDTAGSLKRISEKLKEDFIVCGGSFLIPGFNMKELEMFHKKRESVVSIALAKCENRELLGFYGQAVVKEDGKIISFAEKPSKSISQLIHTTYQIISPNFFEYIEKNEKISIPEVICKLISSGNAVYGYVTEKKLWNVSNIQLYRNTTEYFEKNADELALMVMGGEQNITK